MVILTPVLSANTHQCSFRASWLRRSSCSDHPDSSQHWPSTEPLQDTRFDCWKSFGTWITAKDWSPLSWLPYLWPTLWQKAQTNPPLGWTINLNQSSNKPSKKNLVFQSNECYYFETPGSFATLLLVHSFGGLSAPKRVASEARLSADKVCKDFSAIS